MDRIHYLPEGGEEDAKDEEGGEAEVADLLK